MLTFAQKLELYQRILINEFRREFWFLWEVSRGRAKSKGDFTDKLLDLLKLGVLKPLENVPLPGFNLVTSLLEVGIDWINNERHEAKTTRLGAQHWEIDTEQLRCLLEAVALEAARRYEYIISQLSHDPNKGVIPFALVGVERMLSYICLYRLNPTVENLLQGLFYGPSGAYVSGYNNTPIALHDQQTLSPPNIKLKLRADGVYARPAFVTTGPRYWVLTDKSQAVHRQLHLNQLAIHTPTTVKNVLSKPLQSIKAELSSYQQSSQNVGYTKFHKQIDAPKYGYVNVPEKIAKQFNYQLYSPSGTSTSKAHTYHATWVLVTRTEIETYLNLLATKPKLSFLMWLAQHLGYGVTRAFFYAENAIEADWRTLQLADADFSNCVFPGIRLGGSIARSCWQKAVLTGVNISEVTDAQHADFSGAHLTNLQAKGAKLAGAKLTQGDFTYADLAQADLRGCQLTACKWDQAILEGTQFDAEELQQVQKAQAAQLAENSVRLKALVAQYTTQQTQLTELHIQLTSLINNSKTEQQVTQDTEQLRGLVERVRQEQHARQAFERSCQMHLTELTAQQQSSKQELETLTMHVTALREQAQQMTPVLKELKQLGEEYLGNSCDLIKLPERINALNIQLTNFNQQYDQRLNNIMGQWRLLSSEVSALHAQINAHHDILQQHGHVITQVQKKQAKDSNLKTKCQSLLKDYYQSSDYTALSTITDASNVKRQIYEVFVNLAIVQEVEQKKRETDILNRTSDTTVSDVENKSAEADSSSQSTTERREAQLSAYKTIHQTKTPIALKDLFTRALSVQRKQQDGGTTPSDIAKRLLLLGRAGIGKSTLCKYLSYQWAKGQLLTEFTWVFHVNLRYVAFDERLKSVATLPDLLRALYWPKISSEKASALWKKMKHDKVLWILDGYDEVAHCQLSLIENDLIKQPYCLLTSRPYAAQAQRQQVDAVLENIGLTSENIDCYIEQYFQCQDRTSEQFSEKAQQQSIVNSQRRQTFSFTQNNNTLYQQQQITSRNKKSITPQSLESSKIKANTLIDWLAKQPVVRDVCVIPIYLELLCYVWEQESKTLQYQQQNISILLYQRLTYYLLQSFWKKIKDHPNYPVREDLNLEHQAPVVFAQLVLGRLAFRGLQTGRLLLEGKLLTASLDLAETEIKRLNSKENFERPLDSLNSLSEARYENVCQALNNMLADKFNIDSAKRSLLDELLAAGFLKSVGVSTDKEKDQYYFIHLSVQEYFAALYLAYHLEQEQAFIARYKYDPAWQLTWTMVAGILQNNGSQLTRFFTLLLTPPRDLYGHYEVVFLAQCLEACGVGVKLEENMRKMLWEYMQTWVKSSLRHADTRLINALLAFPLLSEKIEIHKICLDYAKQTKLADTNRLAVYKIIMQGKLDEELVQWLLKQAVASIENKIPLYELLLKVGDAVIITSEVVVELLLKKIEDKHPECYKVILWLLSRIQNPSSKVMQVLLNGIEEKDEQLCIAALTALSHLVKPDLQIKVALLKTAQHQSSIVREKALEMLIETWDVDAEVVQLCLQGLVGENVENFKVSYSASQILQRRIAEIADLSVDVVDLLLNSLTDKDKNLSKQAFYILEKIACSKNIVLSNDAIVQTLLAKVKHDNAQVRTVVLLLLSRVPHPSSIIKQTVLAGTNDTDQDVRCEVLEALENLPNPDDDVRQTLLKSIADPDEDVRYTALRTLVSLVKNDDEVRDVVLKMRIDESAHVRKKAFEAIGELFEFGAEMFEMLQAGMEDESIQVRECIVMMLGQMINSSDDVLKLLLDKAIDDNEEERINILALEALRRVRNQEAKDQVLDRLGTVLLEILEKEEVSLKIFIAINVTLCSLYEPEQKLSAKNVLLAWAKDNNNSYQEVRVQALETLSKINNLDNEVVKVLLKAITDKITDSGVIEAQRCLEEAFKSRGYSVPLGSKNHFFVVRSAAINHLSKLLDEDSPLEFAPLLVDALNEKLEELQELIPLPHLIHAYPDWLINQSRARAALHYHLKRPGVVLVHEHDKYYRCIINKREFTVVCANPKQLERDVLSLREVPMIFPLKDKALASAIGSVGIFKVKNSSNTTSTKNPHSSLPPLTNLP
ncbi:MAG: hypothetical protein Tsb005_15560 [Gammaproteobacteria bacterium]